MFTVIKRTVGLRVSPEVEEAGIDLAYHGIESYPEFTETLGFTVSSGEGGQTPVPQPGAAD